MPAIKTYLCNNNLASVCSLLRIFDKYSPGIDIKKSNNLFENIIYFSQYNSPKKRQPKTLLVV